MNCLSSCHSLPSLHRQPWPWQGLPKPLALAPAGKASAQAAKGNRNALLAVAGVGVAYWLYRRSSTENLGDAVSGTRSGRLVAWPFLLACTPVLQGACELWVCSRSLPVHMPAAAGHTRMRTMLSHRTSTPTCAQASRAGAATGQRLEEAGKQVGGSAGELMKEEGKGLQVSTGGPYTGMCTCESACEPGALPC